ncbi:pre-mRNA-splicing factor CWC22 isoform X2 [Monomorium pharaonis]|uniref:pre-mRNA-splicing factor CWC22 isoform X2 n=1 Tax=Monomorium pharaonis TaxID=307658 RepID=UPI00102E1764|nr:pre-mRNA-splicing factor CWC22 isoform X2 [Monomorium pharaonis]
MQLRSLEGYNPDFFSTTSSRGNVTRRNTKPRKRERSSKKKTTGRSNASKGRRRQRKRSPTPSKGRDRKQSSSVPPKLPRPPSWSPKRRLLIDEPIPKVKHS